MATTKDGTNINTSIRSTMYASGRGGQSVKYIVIHHWGIKGQKHENILNYLTKKRTTKPTSAHFIVSAGRINNIVKMSDTAWHSRQANRYTIGIECRPEMSEGDIETVAQTIAYIRSIYGPLPLKGHKDYVNTDCPGTWYGQLSYLNKRANEIAGNKQSKPQTSTDSSNISKLLIDNDWGPLTTKAIQRRLGELLVDGKASKLTWTKLQKVLKASVADGYIVSQHLTASQVGKGVSDDKYYLYEPKRNTGSETIKLIQKQLNMTPNGIITKDFIGRMQKELNDNSSFLKG